MRHTVVLDARCAGPVPCGIDRYARGLVAALGRAGSNFRLVALARPGVALAFSGVETVPCPLEHDGVANLVVGHHAVRRALGRTPDLFHALFHVVPRGALSRWRTVVTFHDAIWLTAARDASRSPLRAAALRGFGAVAIPHALRRASAVICPSDASARAARALSRRVPDVIEHGLDHVGAESRRRRGLDAASECGPQGALRRGTPYFCALASPKRYKGTETIVRAFEDVARERSDAWLVLFGDTASFERRLAASSAGQRIARFGRLDDRGRTRLIASSRLFVFASNVEGFGFPPLEAMAAGAAVAVPAVEPVASLAGEGALRFDAADSASLARLMIRALDEDLAQRMGARAMDAVGRFTWDRTARRTLQVYERVLRIRSATA